MPSELQQLKEKWDKSLRECQFVGEIAISPGELEIYSSFLDEYLSKYKHIPSCSVLLVIAVNCAYFDYDDEGFWVHFCQRLGIPNENSWHDYIGRSFESCLKEYGLFRRERYGTFRFVGAILEQCGITKRYLPKFTDFIKTLKSSYGWDGLRAIDYQSYISHVPNQGISGFLSKFLKEHSGWDFVRDVARNISQYQNGFLGIKDLEKARGYHPGFWPEVFKNLGYGKKGPGLKSASFAPFPKLMFYPELGEIAIVFDENEVRRGSYKLDGQLVTNSNYVLKNRNDFSETFHVNIKKEKRVWISNVLNGWNPRKIEFALFNPNKGYISNLTSLHQADYYLLTPFEMKVPDHVAAIDYGCVPLPFGNSRMYRGWQIHIDSQTDLSFLGLTLGGIDREFISWETPINKLKGACDIADVFTGSLPKLKVKQASLFSSNALALFTDFGKGIKRITLDGNLEEVLLSLTPPVPSKGEIWVESIGRLREFSGEDVIDRLSYCLVPKCSIKWPGTLLENADKPEIKLITKYDVSIQIENGKQLDSDGKLWQAPSHANIFEGNLKISSVSARIAGRLFRSTLNFFGEDGNLFLTKKNILEETKLVGNGVPESEAKLALIIPSGGTYPLADLGVFEKNGEVNFSSYALRDTIIKIKDPVGQFAFINKGKLVLTETLFLNTDEMKYQISTGRSELAWCNYLDDRMANAFRALNKIETGTLTNSSFRLFEHIPGELEDWIKEVLVCAMLFDDVKIDEIPGNDIEISLSYVDGKIADGLRWYKKAATVIQGQLEPNEAEPAGDLLDQLGQIEWRPQIRRWQKLFNDVIQYLKTITDFAGLIDEWAAEVNGPFLVRYKSNIAGLHMGNHLTIAWRSYSRKDYFDSYGRANPLIKKTQSPVSDLSLIVSGLSLLRKGRFEQAFELIVGFNGHLKFKSLISSLLYLANTLSLGNSENDLQDFEDSVDTSLLPLREEDKALLNHNFMEPISKEVLGKKEYKDWLLLLACYCQTIKNGEVELAMLISLELNKTHEDPHIDSVVKSILGK